MTLNWIPNRLHLGLTSPIANLYAELTIMIKIFSRIIGFSARGPRKSDVPDEQEKLDQEVNDFLRQHPNAEIQWLQSSAGADLTIKTQLTAIVKVSG